MSQQKNPPHGGLIFYNLTVKLAVSSQRDKYHRTIIYDINCAPIARHIYRKAAG